MKLTRNLAHKRIFYLIIVILFLAGSCATAQKKIAKYIFVENGKSGLLDATGKTIVPAKYKKTGTGSGLWFYITFSYGIDFIESCELVSGEQ